MSQDERKVQQCADGETEADDDDLIELLSNFDCHKNCDRVDLQGVNSNPQCKTC